MTLDMILTIVVLSFWFIFPIGMFLSVSHVDKNTDQIVRLDELRHYAESDVPEAPSRYKETKVDWRPHGPFARRRYGH